MSLPLTCPHCHATFTAPAAAAGKTAHCPHCAGAVSVPVAVREGVPPKLPAESTADVKSPDKRWKVPEEQWFVQAEDGRQFGPVTREQLHQWYEEGRITGNCQILRKGASQWQWATDLFPDLDEAAAPQPNADLPPPQPAPARAAPTQSAFNITPLDPNDFPTAGTGLKSLGYQVPMDQPGYAFPRQHDPEAMENRRKFAPYMVARKFERPMHIMLVVTAILNMIVGTLRSGFYFWALIMNVLALGAIGEESDDRTVLQVALSLLVSFGMLALSVMLISSGIGLLQRRTWGRTSTYFSAGIDGIVQLTAVCVVQMLGAEVGGLGRWVFLVVFLVLLPSIVYDIYAVSVMSVGSVVDVLEE